MTQSIDLTNFSLQDLKVLEEQIALRKRLIQLRTYRVSFDVTFDAHSHPHSRLAPDGLPSTASFFDYFQQVVKPIIVRDFSLCVPEGVGRIIVDLRPPYH